MVPTARADALAGPVRKALEDLDQALGAGAPFDPASVWTTFRIAAVDLAQVLVLPTLMARLAAAARTSSLVTRPPDHAARDLADGTLDISRSERSERTPTSGAWWWGWTRSVRGPL